MFNFRPIQIPSVTAITAAILLIAGCGGGGGGGGGGGTSFPDPTLPSAAVVFDSTNAVVIANAALDSRDSLGIAAREEDGSAPSIRDAIKLVTDQAFGQFIQSRSVATGVVTQTISTTCDNGGTYTATFTGTGNSVSGSTSGTVTFSNCEFSGLVIDGSFSFNNSWTNTVNFVNTGGGNITFTFNLDTYTLVMNFNETVDTSTGDFSVLQNFSVSGSVAGVPPGGFLVTTTTPLVGNYLLGEIYSGQLLIQGGNNTQIRITVIATNTASVELDDGLGGGFVVVAGSPILISP